MNSNLRHSISMSDLVEAPQPNRERSPSPNQNERLQSGLSKTVVPPLPGTQFGLQHWLQQQNSNLSSPDLSAKNNMQMQTVSVATSPPTQTLPKAAVFWDFENCPPPAGMPGYVVVENIRNVIHHFGHVVLFKAYLEISDNPNQKTMRSLRSELQSSGVSLTDCPHNGRKDAADKMMMVDMLAFAIDHPPPAAIVLISGDRDFVYALSTLRNRRYTIVLIVPNKGAPIILKSQANAILEWRYDVLNQDIWTMQQQQMIQQEQQNLDKLSPNAGNLSSPPMSDNSVATSPDSISSNIAATSDVSMGSMKTSVSKEPPERKRVVSAEMSNTSKDRVPANSTAKEVQHKDSLAKEVQQKDSPAKEVQQKDSSNLSSNQPKAQTVKPSISISLPAAETLADQLKQQELGSNGEYCGYVYSPKLPGFFDLLVEVLEKFRMAGEVQVRRSKVGNELIRINPLLYHRAGCSSFKEFIDLAAKEGIVTVGGEKGLAWVSLHENYRDKVF